jgi:hypothetical protein
LAVHRLIAADGVFRRELSGLDLLLRRLLLPLFLRRRGRILMDGSRLLLPPRRPHQILRFPLPDSGTAADLEEGGSGRGDAPVASFARWREYGQARLASAAQN